jgi:hypothetical protein
LDKTITRREMMKIEQKAEFQPITLTIETAEEAEAVWKAIAEGSVSAPLAESRSILCGIDVWFCNLSNGGADISKDN